MKTLFEQVQTTLARGLKSGESTTIEAFSTVAGEVGERYTLVAKEDGPLFKVQGPLKEKMIIPAQVGEVMPKPGQIFNIAHVHSFSCNSSAQEVRFTKAYLMTESDYQSINATIRPEDKERHARTIYRADYSC